MKKLFFFFLLFVAVNINAQKKLTITERNFAELKSDLAKAQQGLNMAKKKLAKVENTCKLIAQKKVNQLEKKEQAVINFDSVLTKIKYEKRRNFEAANARVGRWQKRFDKFNNNYNTVLTNNAVVPNKHDFNPIMHNGAYITFNPIAIVELQQGAVGLGFGYRILKKAEIFAEASYLYKGFATLPENFKNLQGFRGIVSGKYFFKNKHHFFAGLEFRYKQYSFDDKSDFENLTTVDTLFQLNNTLRNTLYGGAALFGKRFKITSNGKFEIEAIIGIGCKYRFVNYNNVPAGYSKILYASKGGFGLYPIYDNYTQQQVAYFPATVRLLYHF